MEPEWVPVRNDPAAQHVWQTVLRPIAAQMATGAAELAGRIIDYVEGERPESDTGTHAVAEQRAGIEASLGQLAQIIDAGGNPRGLDWPTAAVEISRLRVQQSLPLVDRRCGCS